MEPDELAKTQTFTELVSFLKETRYGSGSLSIKNLAIAIVEVLDYAELMQLIREIKDASESKEA